MKYKCDKRDVFTARRGKIIGTLKQNHISSFWEKDSFLQPHDLIVIGAGIVGLSSALFYKRNHPEARILVIDKGFMPQGASTRNAGFACVGSVGELMADLKIETEQNVKNRLLKRFRGLQLLRGTLGDEAINYENCGGYELFISPEKFKEAASQIDYFNKLFFDITGEKKVYEEVKFEGHSAIYNRLEGSLHPGKMVQALTNKAVKMGIEIKWNCEATQIKDESINVEPGYTLYSNQILVAANGFTPKLLAEMPVKPARGFVMVTQPWNEMPWKGIFHHNKGYIYFRNVGKRLLFGGARNIASNEEETDEFGVNNAIKNHLLGFAKEILKLPQGCEIEYEWSGIMGFTPSKTPIVKLIDKYTAIAAGLSGMGVAIGMEVGKEAVELLNVKKKGK